MLDINSLESIRYKRAARIPRGLATEIFKPENNMSLSEVRALMTFYSLKPLFTPGVIKDYNKNLKQLSEFLGCSVTTLRLRLKTLEEYQLIKVKKNNLGNKDVIFTSYKLAKTKISNLIPNFIEPIKQVDKKDFKQNVANISVKNHKNLEEVLYALAIDNNFQKQKHKLVGFLITKELKISSTNLQRQDCSPFSLKKRIGEKTYKKIRKHISSNFSYFCYKHRHGIFEDLRVTNQTFNPDITIGSRGSAKLYGKKSISSGNRILNKLKGKNYISRNKREFFLDMESIFDKNKISFQEFILFRNGIKSERRHRLIFKGGNILIKKTDKVIINDNILFNDFIIKDIKIKKSNKINSLNQADNI